MSREPPQAGAILPGGSPGRFLIAVLLAIILWAILALVLTLVTAHAAPPTLTLDPAIAAWFRDLRHPVTGAYCCSTADGHVLSSRDWRVVGDGYEVKIGEAFVPVPAQNVLDRIDNPTGSAVAFWMPGQTYVLCFVRAAEI